jgi:hypothetical protein
MVTVFFTSSRLLVPTFLPKGTKFNQDHFIDTVLPNLYREKRRIARRKCLPSFSVHIDNSMCYTFNLPPIIFRHPKVERITVAEVLWGAHVAQPSDPICGNQLRKSSDSFHHRIRITPEPIGLVAMTALENARSRRTRLLGPCRQGRRLCFNPSCRVR